MHIPDGYLGPTTWGTSWALAAVGLSYATKKVKESLDEKLIPMLAVSAAFSFLIMMFNIPIPGGTSGHAAGGVLVAVIIGPWAAFLSVSVALIIQAIVFGDGGITAIGANCINIAFIMPMSGYILYQILTKLFPDTNKSKAVAAGISGWFGLNMAAFTTAVMFGIQPLLHTDASGQALYSPYPLSVAVPAMVFEHVLLFGPVEGIVTGFTVYSLLKSESLSLFKGAEV